MNLGVWCNLEDLAAKEELRRRLRFALGKMGVFLKLISSRRDASYGCRTTTEGWFLGEFLLGFG